jgi:alanine racemase
MMVNIGTDNAYCGDEVVLIGQSGNVQLTINELAELYGGSAYEFLVLLNSRIARQYLPVMQNSSMLNRYNDLDASLLVKRLEDSIKKI